MNKNNNSAFPILAAGLAGVALASVSNTAYLASLPGEVVMAIAASAAILAFAIRDYAREIRPLTVKAPALRPAAPAAAPRARAYGIRRQAALVERSAA